MPAFTDLFQNVVNSVFEVPIGIMLFKFRDVADIPDVISDAVGFIILINRLFSKDIFELFIKEKIYLDYAQKELSPQQIDQFDFL